MTLSHAVSAVYPSLRDRVVLVTGGASGIGAEHVSQFARQGAKVAFLDIADDAASALIASLRAEGLPPPFYQSCDLTDIPALQASIAEVNRRLGNVTVLVNNAANDQRHGYEDVTVAFWDERMATNLRHQFFAIQAIAPQMRSAGGGSIINFGSISWHARVRAACLPTPQPRPPWRDLTKGMARDLGPVRHTGQLRHSRLDHDAAADRPVADPGSRGKPAPRAVPEGQAGAGRTCRAWSSG